MLDRHLDEVQNQKHFEQTEKAFQSPKERIDTFDGLKAAKQERKRLEQEKGQPSHQQCIATIMEKVQETIESSLTEEKQLQRLSVNAAFPDHVGSDTDQQSLPVEQPGLDSSQNHKSGETRSETSQIMQLISNDKQLFSRYFAILQGLAKNYNLSVRACHQIFAETMDWAFTKLGVPRLRASEFWVGGDEAGYQAFLEMYRRLPISGPGSYGQTDRVSEANNQGDNSECEEVDMDSKSDLFKALFKPDKNRSPRRGENYVEVISKRKGGNYYRTRMDLSSSEMKIDILRVEHGEEGCHMHVSDIVAQHLIISKKYAKKRNIEVSSYFSDIKVVIHNIEEDGTVTDLKEYINQSFEIGMESGNQPSDIFGLINNNIFFKMLKYAEPQFRKILDLDHSLRITKVTIGDFSINRFGEEQIDDIQFDMEQ